MPHLALLYLTIVWTGCSSIRSDQYIIPYQARMIIIIPCGSSFYPMQHLLFSMTHVGKLNGANICFTYFYTDEILRLLYTNISSVVEFQRWWVLKSKLFGQESTCHQGKIFKKFLRVMTVCQKVTLKVRFCHFFF